MFVCVFTCADIYVRMLTDFSSAFDYGHYYMLELNWRVFLYPHVRACACVYVSTYRNLVDTRKLLKVLIARDLLRTRVRASWCIYVFVRPIYIYLVQKLCFRTGIIFIRVNESMCVYMSVCKSFPQLSQSSWPILMQFGMMIYNNKRQIPFEDEKNRFGGMHTSPIRKFKITISYKSQN